MIREAPEWRITYGKGGGIQFEEVILFGYDEYRSSKYLGDLPGISNDKNELQARTKRIRMQKYLREKLLNAQQQPFWPHLCGEDP